MSKQKQSEVQAGQPGQYWGSKGKSLLGLSEIIPIYTQARLVDGLAPSTLEWYSVLLVQYERWLITEQRAAQWAESESIESYLAARRQDLKPNSVAGAYRTLNTFFGWLIKRKQLSGRPNPFYQKLNPLGEIEMRTPPKIKPRSVELEEYDLFLSRVPANDWIDMRDRLAIQILFLCGLRAAEVVGLRLDDFQPESSLLIVRGGKGGHDRPVPLPPAIAHSFAAFLFVRPDTENDEVFISSYSNGYIRDGAITPNGLRQMLRRRCKDAGVRYINPHAFRHGLAMHLLNKGGDMSLVQKILGHSRISTTSEHYARWLTNPMIRAYNEIMQDNN